MKKTSNSVAFVLLLAVAVAGALGGLYFLGERAKETEAEAIERPADPDRPPSGAFAVGGQPTTSGPARAVFQEALPEFVIELDGWGRSHSDNAIEEDLRGARGALMGAARKAGVDPSVFERLERLVDSCMRAATAPESELDDAADDFMQRTLELNDALASASMGFFVDGELLTHSSGERSVLLFSFEILRVVLYRSGGHDVRTLRVRRLDNLNWSYSLLGFTAPQRRDAVVLDNKVDEHLLELLPALSTEARMDPFHLAEKDTHTAWFNPTRTLATAIIREELGSAGDESLQELGDLLARRVEIYQAWNEELDARGLHVDPPSSLEITWNYRAQMEGLVTHGAMDELDALQEKLASDSMRAAYRRVHDHFAQSVERHETQHRLDLAELYALPMPDVLAAYVGELPDGYRGKGGLASGALAELSAYLSELARDPKTPRLNLSLLVGYTLNPTLWGTGESYAALVILEGLADELSIEHREFVVARSIDRAAVAEVYAKLSAVETDVLRNSARSLWAQLFKARLPRLELVAR